jgi:hypothetical protein
VPSSEAFWDAKEQQIMRRQITLAALFLAIPVLLLGQGPMKVGSLTFAPATTIAEIDTDRVKGQPSKVAWSPDGSELYVQLMDGEFARRAEAKFSHHVYKVDGGKHQTPSSEPEWVSEYWTAKSGQASPDLPAFKIDLKSETRKQHTTSTPMGGNLARGGGVGADGGTATSGDALAAAYNSQAVPVNTMLLHGQVIGEYVNSVIVPGQTFGWGPKGSKVIAYASQNGGRVVVMDDTGRRQEIEETKDALFPAWSPDGTRLAWLQKDGKKKFILKTLKID